MTESKDQHSEQHESAPRNDTGRSEWYPPKPANIAEPTYWPIILAAGITLLAWGAVTSFLMSALGLILIVAAVVKWIGDIRHDRGYEQAKD